MADQQYSFFSPSDFIRFALTKITAIQWAVGVGALVAVLAISSHWGLPPFAMVLGTIALLLFMVALFVIQQLIYPPKTTTKKIPPTSLAVLWTAVLLFISCSAFTASSFFFNWPIPLVDMLLPHDKEIRFPKGDYDVQMTGRLLSSVGSGLSSLDRQHSLFDSFCSEIDIYLQKTDRNDSDYEELKKLGVYTKNELNKSKGNFLPFKNDILVWLNTTTINAADAEMLPTVIENDAKNLSENVESLLKYIAIGYPLKTAEQMKIVSISRESAYQMAKMYWFAINELLLPVDQESPIFEKILEPTLTMLNFFPISGIQWTTEIKECQRKQEQALNRTSALYTTFATIVGDQRRELFLLESAFSMIPRFSFEVLKKIDKAEKALELVRKGSLPLLEDVWNSQGQGATPTSRNNKSKLIVEDIKKYLAPSMGTIISHGEMIKIFDAYSKINRTPKSTFAVLQKYIDQLETTQSDLQRLFAEVCQAPSVKVGQIKVQQILLQFDFMDLWLQYSNAQIQLMFAQDPNSKLALEFTQNTFNYIPKIVDNSATDLLNTRYEELLERKKSLIVFIADDLKYQEISLQQLREQAKDKFAIQPDDDAAIVWGKMSMLLAAGFKEDALDALDKYLERTDDQNAQAYTTKAKSYIQQKYPRDFNGGVVVIGFGNNGELNPLLIGDIITAIDGNIVRDADDFARLKTPRNQRGMIMDLWRLKEDNHFKSHTVKIKPGGPRVGVASLSKVID